MARTNKVGIDYFPFDVDFFNDEKIEFTSARFGVKGEIVAIRLLCKIYRNGYYSDWNEDEITLFAKRAGDGITPSLVSEIVNELVKRGFFEKSLLNRFKILTSSGIQKRYFEITRRYKTVDVIKEYLLINIENNDNVSINSINADINPINTNTCTQIEIEIENKFKIENKELVKVICDWFDYKKSRRESYKNDKSISQFIVKLRNLSGDDPEKARLIVNESMANNWAGIFELKTNGNFKGKQTKPSYSNENYEKRKESLKQLLK